MIKLVRSVTALGAVLITVMGFDALAATKTLEYTVLRDGSPIGTHAYTIETNGTDTNVAVTTDIKVKALFITVYKFIHESKEKWQNGQLVSLKSTTDDDGTPKSLQASAENGKITLDATINKQERRQFAPSASIPASLWNPALVTQGTVLKTAKGAAIKTLESQIVNTLDGQLMKVKIADLGNEEVEAQGTKVSANHYQITGELTRDLWYNSDGDLVRVSFPDKTETSIVYSLN